jgi:phosphonate transport system substrate-binding protein
MPATQHRARTFLCSGLVLTCLLMLFAACGSGSSSTTTTSTGSGSNSSSSCPHQVSLSQLNFGIIPADSATSVQDATKPFSDALSKQICKPVHLFVGTNYSSIITAMTSKQADVAFFGPLSYVLAADKGNAEAISRVLAPANHADHYFSYIITTPKTGIKTLADLKGKTFSFTDPASTSGNLMPRYVLKQNNLDPDKDIKATYVGSHDLSLNAVLSGKVQAGAVASDTFDLLLSEGKFKSSDIVIVAKSVAIPEGPIAVRKDLSASDKDALQAAFLSITDPAALKAIDAGGFIKDVDSTYNPIRDMAKSLGLDLTKLVK